MSNLLIGIIGLLCIVMLFVVTRRAWKNHKELQELRHIRNLYGAPPETNGHRQSIGEWERYAHHGLEASRARRGDKS